MLAYLLVLFVVFRRNFFQLKEKVDLISGDYYCTNKDFCVQKFSHLKKLFRPYFRPFFNYFALFCISFARTGSAV